MSKEDHFTRLSQSPQW